MKFNAETEQISDKLSEDATETDETTSSAVQPADHQTKRSGVRTPETFTVDQIREN